MCSNPTLNYVTYYLILLKSSFVFCTLLTHKTKNYIFPIFLQIYRILYANGEKLMFFRHSLLFFTNSIMFQQKLEIHL